MSNKKYKLVYGTFNDEIYKYDIHIDNIRACHKAGHGRSGLCNIITDHINKSTLLSYSFPDLSTRPSLPVMKTYQTIYESDTMFTVKNLYNNCPELFL